MSQSLQTIHEFGSVSSRTVPVSILSGTSIGDLTGKDRVILVKTTGAATATMSAASIGTIKTVILDTDGGDLVITPSTLLGGTTITMADAGDSFTAIYTRAGWALIANNGSVVA